MLALPGLVFVLSAAAVTAASLGVRPVYAAPPGAAQRGTLTVSTTTDSVPRGAADLFLRRCARCHGEDGSGSGRRAGGPNCPDFTNRDWQKHRTDAELMVSILEGKGTQMPAFRGRFSDGQARDLVLAVRSFAPAPAQRRADPAPDDFEERFSQLEKEFQDLQRQYREVSTKARKR
jgi:mono/diheme cytochrome c family protein